MFSTIEIVAVAFLGVGAAALLQGRVLPLLYGFPILGFAHAAVTFAATSVAADHSPAWLGAGLQEMSDPYVIVAAFVAFGAGGFIASALLRRATDDRATASILDFERPTLPASKWRRTVGTERQKSTLSTRIAALPDQTTRALVQKGYRAAEQPVLEIAPSPRPTLPQPREAVEVAAHGRVEGVTTLPGPLSASTEANQRRSARARTLLRGQILAEPGLSCRCTIHDLSLEGARVRLPPATRAPKRVVLLDLSNGLAHEARVQWRNGDTLGLQFSRTHDLTNPSSPEAAALHLHYKALQPR